MSYAVLKAKYHQETVWIGETKDTVSEEFLILYKNRANECQRRGHRFCHEALGAILPSNGETISVNKYFLDIDKVQRFPITFVVKSDETSDQIRAAIRAQAVTKYKIEAVVDSYMKAIEEIINVEDLVAAFDTVVKSGQLQTVMDEIVIQSKVEFNYSDDDEDENGGTEEVLATWT